MLKEPRIRNKDHLRFVSTLPCMKCGIEGYSQAAHLGRAGMGLKRGDDETAPLCATRPGILGCHARFDQYMDKEYWNENLTKAKTLAQSLYAITGDEVEARKLIGRWI